MAEPIAQDGITDLDGLRELMDTMGRGALSEAEYQRLEEAQRVANFAPGAWHENLLDEVDEVEQGLIATDIWKWVNWDEESREQWHQREMAGIRMMGVTDEVELPPEALRFDGMSQLVHPGFAQAIMEFWSRAFVELFPPEGPCKGVVLGKANDKKEAQSKRVGDFINYQYTQKMPDAYVEWSRLLFRLGISGSMFTKIYYDHEEETAMVIAVEPADMIVPYTANDLRTAPRYTHRMWTASHIVKGRMESGFYSDKPLVFATEASYPETRRVIEDAEGREPTLFVEDRRHCILECHCWYAIKSLNKLVGMDEKKPLPWVITMDRDSQKLLSIRRNWRKTDSKMKKRLWFSHKRFLPGLGFYGYGLAHMMAGLSRTQTGALRALMDAAGMENMGGGFMAADVRMGDDNGPLGMGEWRRVEATSEELSRAFFPRPKIEPSETLFKLLGYLDEKQQAISSTTEIQVGDANNNAPVGTTLALIEQGAKKETAIRFGLHIANAEEFKILAEMDGEFLPEIYPYAVKGDDKFIMRSDFDDKVDVWPVSDPRLTSQTQRISQQQAVLQLIQTAPDLYTRKARIHAHRTMFQYLHVADVDDLLSEDEETRRMEPVEENMALLTGKPVMTHADQDHAAHTLVHQDWFSKLQPEFQQVAQGAFMAHLAEHLAWQYRLQMEQAMGVALPFPQTMAADTDDTEERPELPPEVENEIAVRAAQAVQLLAQQAQAQAEEQQAVNELKAKQQKLLALKEKEDTVQHQEALKDHSAMRQIERNSAIAQAEKQQKAEADDNERIRQESEQYAG